jgi:dTDP-4-dehydrorhamnose 3,5-epimerase
MTEPSPIPGVTWGSIVRHEDERGSFRELWRAATFADLAPRAAGLAEGSSVRFVQSNLSLSAVGVLRGLHFHRRQLDYWVVASGRAFVALVDVRPAIAQTGPPILDAREAAPDTTVAIPAGVAHGFLAIDPLELIYFVTNEYDGADELGFAWDDGDAAVPWPALPGSAQGRPILSPRDAANPSLQALVEQLRALEDRPG